MKRHPLHSSSPPYPLYEMDSTEFKYPAAQKRANQLEREDHTPYIRKRKAVFTSGSVYTVFAKK